MKKKVMIEFIQKFMPDDDEIPAEDQEGVKNISAKCKIVYSDICLFEETGEIFQCNKKNYPLSIFVGVMANKMHLSVVSSTHLHGRN